MTAASVHIANSAGLRSRKVDLKKALAVIRFDTVGDPEELAAMSRLTANVSTGVEKGEEEEHHLQAALVSRHAVVIPTPDASGLVDLPNYESYYVADYQLPHSLIKYSDDVEDGMGCSYNLTDDDLVWLDQQLDESERAKISDDEFELAIFFLDECGNDKVSGECPEFEECLDALEKSESRFKPTIEKESLLFIYEYWKETRYQKNDGKMLRPVLKSEDMSTNPDNDPYVCFRIREIKIQRKVRRSDTLALDKLRKLKQDMYIVKELLQLASERELVRKEIIECNKVVFEKRMHVRRIKRFLGINTADTLDASPEKIRRRHRLDGESTKIRIPLSSLREAASLVTDMESHLFEDSKNQATELKIQETIEREKSILEKSGWLDCTEFPFRPTTTCSLWGSHLGIESRFGIHVSSRRRLGRGGRIVFDRHVQFNRQSVDSRPQDPVEPSIPLPNHISSLVFRGFNLNQPHESKADLQCLHNKTMYNHSTFDPSVIPPIPKPPTDIIRESAHQPSSTQGGGTRKRNVKVSGGGGGGGTPNLGATAAAGSASTMGTGKSVEELKAEQVKDFLKRAQLQAQQQAMMQKAGMVGSNPGLGSPLSFGTGNIVSTSNNAGDVAAAQQMQQQLQQQQQQMQMGAAQRMMAGNQAMMQLIQNLPPQTQAHIAQMPPQQQAQVLLQIQFTNMSPAQKAAYLQQQQQYQMMQFQMMQQQMMMQQQHQQLQQQLPQDPSSNNSQGVNNGNVMQVNGGGSSIVFNPDDGSIKVKQDVANDAMVVDPMPAKVS